MTSRLMIAALGALIWTTSAGAEDVTTQTVIDKVTAARGGEASIEDITSMRTLISISEGETEVFGDYRATRDGLMRIDIFVGDRLVYSEGIDAKGPWERSGPMNGPTIAVDNANAIQSLENGILFNLYGLHEYDGLGHDVELVGEETLDGTEYDVLRLTLNNGFETYRYAAADTGKIERHRDMRALPASADAKDPLLETRFSGFEKRCGVTDPSTSKQVDAKTGETLQITKVLYQACNMADGDLNLARFDQPLARPDL